MKNSFDHTLSLISGRLESWYEVLAKNLPNLFAALTIIILFIFLSGWAGRLTKTLTRRKVRSLAIVNLSATFVQFLLLTIGLFISLGILNLDKTVTSLLAGAGVIGLALGFAFQEIASNFVSGVFIAFREPYKIGDIVEVEGYKGYVRSIDLRTTLIETFQGIEIFIPNQYMFTKPLKNISGTPLRRLDIDVGVSYGDDLRKVTDVIKSSLNNLQSRIAERAIEVFFKDFGSSSINCEVRVWLHYNKHTDYLAARHDAIVRIKEAFDENEITIPFPIRTLDFGIKGGESLQEPLLEVFQKERFQETH